MTPRARSRVAPARPHAAAQASPQPPSDGVRWLRAVDSAPRVVDLTALSRRLDEVLAPDAARWRAAQLVSLLIGADLDAGPGSVTARWDAGVPIRSVDLASRGGLALGEVEGALHDLFRVGVLTLADAHAAANGGVRTFHDLDWSADLVARVAPECVSDGPAASVAWTAVATRLAGSAAALLATRALADYIDRPGRPAVVPYSRMANATRYSEGMVKRGIAAAVAAEVVVSRASTGRAPTYSFTEWALGRDANPNAVPGQENVGRRASNLGASQVAAERAPNTFAAQAGMLRASVAGVSVEVPAATGGDLTVETVVDGRPVTARLTIPPLRS